MSLINRKVCLLIAGGTILADNDDFFVEEPSDVQIWMDKMPELMIMGKIEPVFVCGEKTNLHGAKLWKNLANEVCSRLKNYNGFIVTSPTNDVLYNSIALSFALPNIPKPVVFTGSQLPVVNKNLLDKRKQPYSGLGVKPNLINAVQVAGMEFGAVGIMFGNRCLMPTKTNREDIYSMNIFTSVDDSCLAKIDFGISMLKEVPDLTGPFQLKDNFSENVTYLKYYPGMDFAFFKKITAGTGGVIFEALTLEPFGKDFLDGLKTLKKPILVYNRFYVPKLNAENIIEVFGLTKESAIVKFIWALGQSNDVNEIRSLMLNNLRGEFINKCP